MGVRADTVVRRDTIKAPIAAFETPIVADSAGSFVWTRETMFSMGALTVQDLLDRVVGVTGIQSSWIAQPMMATYLGAPGRIRVFLDGLELEELDPRMRRTWDLTQIPLWALDDIRIERGASEIRVHLRTWRVDRTAPYTRTDIATGDQATNVYRGLFGRRYEHGEVLQLAGQQFSTTPGRLVQSSDQLSVFGRVGWAGGGWSADALLLRADRNRGLTVASSLRDTVPATESTRSDAYLRLGWGSSGRGPWVQALASTSKYAFAGVAPAFPATTPTVNTDTVRSRSQYMLSGGYVRGPFQFSLTQRYFVGMERRVATPAARAGYESSFAAVSVFGEGRGLDSTRRFEVAATVRPTPFTYVGGAYGTESPRIPVDSIGSRRFTRLEGGVRLHDVWFSGGILSRSRALLPPLTIVNARTAAVVDSGARGAFARVHGRVWKAVYVDAHGLQWSDTAAFYRPRYQTRAQVYLSTSWLSRFPSGNFHLLASATHEYRSATLWPEMTDTIRLKGYRTVSTLLQFRIVNAELFWDYRNVLGERYQQVPGYQLPRITSIYGVRWEFWN